MNVLRPRRAFPLILGVGMGIGLGLGGLSLSTVAWAQAPAARPGAPVPPLRLAGPQGLGLLPGNHLGPAGPGILRIVSMQGEVLLDKGGHGSATTEPLTATAVLAAHDELSTHNGSVELAGPAGINLRLSGDALMALLAPNAFYLARGELEVMSQNALPPGPGPGQNQTTISVATSCGRTAVRAKEAHLRVDGPATVASVYDGTVFLGGYPPSGLIVQSGQSGRCVKGEPMAAARPLLPAPLWMGGSELFLVGDGGSPTEVTLRWQVVPAAQRYRVELYRSEGEAEVFLSSMEAPATRPQIELRELDSGSYVAHIHAIDENGALGQEDQPHRFLLARIAGLGIDGTLRTEPGVLPKINGPAELTTSMLIDNAVPTPGAPTPGPHKLRVMIAGLSAEVPLLAGGQVTPPPAPEPPAPTQAQNENLGLGHPIEIQEPPSPPSGAVTAASPPPEAQAEQKASETEPAATDSGGPEDLLFGGVGEVPFGGIRSPWAGRYLGGHIESTTSGSFRVSAVGRWTMKNGFGFDVSIDFLRAALANIPTGEDAVNFGNINAAVRTPALHRKHLALQGIVGLGIPLSTSFLDRSIEQDPQFVNPGDGSTILRADVLARGGGWRIEPALLFSVRGGRFTFTTTQGLVLRVSPDENVAYAGGLMMHANVISALRFVAFASWQVNYLGLAINPGDSTPDVGGAVGGGFEGLIPVGKAEDRRVRLTLLGRVGLGDAGAAIYGRGAIGLQVGYLFN